MTYESEVKDMVPEKIDEYYQNVSTMSESFYGLGKVVMSKLDGNAVTSLLNMDLLGNHHKKAML